MATKKVTDLTELNEAPANGDFVHIVDVSDTTADPAGTSFKMTVANLVTSIATAVVTAALSAYYTADEIDTLLGNYALASSVPSFADDETPAGTIDGANKTFTLAEDPDTDASLILIRNRMVMIRGTDYTLTGQNIIFSSAPPSGAIIKAWYRY